MNTTKLTGLIASVLMALTLSTATYAQPRHMAPRHHPAPVYHHPAPVHHHAPHHGYRYHNDVAGALFAGALILGTAALVGNAINNNQVTSTTNSAAENTANITTENTRFWCESEQGYYPDVRACPSGWKTVPIQ